MTEILVRLATVDDTAGLASLLRSIGWFGRISE